MSKIPPALLLPSKTIFVDRIFSPLPLGVAGTPVCPACNETRPTETMRYLACRHLVCVACLANWFMGDNENRCQLCLTVDNRERHLFILPYSRLGDGFTRDDVNVALQTEFEDARRTWLNFNIPVAMDVMRADLMGQQISERTKRDWYYDVIQGFPKSFQLLNGTMPVPVGPECQIDWKWIRGPLLGAIWALRKVVEGQYGIGWNDGESDMFNGHLVGAVVKILTGMNNEYVLSIVDLRDELLEKLNAELAAQLGAGSSLARVPRTLQILGDVLIDFAAALANDAHCLMAHVQRPPHRR